jgi:hypothetical protein
MSSHFNYELDERNLRTKLRDMQTPYKEDAWLQFESYSNEHHVAHKSGALPSFNLNINRTLILPFVFGGVIILFSLLLFNFISIKDKKAIPEKELANRVIQKTNPPVVEKKTPVIITETESKTDTAQAKKEEPAAVTPSVEAAKINPPAVTPSVTSVPANVTAQAGNWTTIEAGKIYSSPNIASQVIGNAGNNQTFKAIEETVYFIKVILNNNETGYIRKSSVKKNGSAASQNSVVPEGQKERKKKRRAETLESIQTPVNLSGGEAEPELR